jgi:hypothetical protein
MQAWQIEGRGTGCVALAALGAFPLAATGINMTIRGDCFPRKPKIGGVPICHFMETRRPRRVFERGMAGRAEKLKAEKLKPGNGSSIHLTEGNEGNGAVSRQPGNCSAGLRPAAGGWLFLIRPSAQSVVKELLYRTHLTADYAEGADGGRQN